ncbi:hypothetical protein [Kutzneria sp. NPDC052558]|uniref:hypothetical protein n=1 Tax=Kutzneria sp. NPDC052558 TaxID=3364121 RepID=UPI0037C86E7D
MRKFNPFALAKRIALVVSLLAVALFGSTAMASAADAPQLVKVALTLDCAHMTAQAHDYAVDHGLCTRSGGITPQGVVTGDCGDSYIWVTNRGGGTANISYGFDSSLGTVVYRGLHVSWYNWGTGGASGWDDSGFMFSSSYGTNSNIRTGAGWVTAGLTGYVELVWGGECTLLQPTAGGQITP